MEKLRKWKKEMKFMKGLRVNSVIRDKGHMQCRVNIVQSEDSGEHPYGVCRKRVGSHSIMCMECLKWNHSLERTERMEVRWICVEWIGRLVMFCKVFWVFIAWLWW